METASNTKEKYLNVSLNGWMIFGLIALFLLFILACVYSEYVISAFATACLWIGNICLVFYIFWILYMIIGFIISDVIPFLSKTNFKIQLPA